LLIGVEGYSTPVGKRDSRDPEANTMLVTKALSQNVPLLAFVPLAKEAARRSPTGSSTLRESEASATNVLSVRKRSVSNKASSLERKSPPHFARAIFLFSTKKPSYHMSDSQVKSVIKLHIFQLQLI